MPGLSPAGFNVPTFAETRQVVVDLWRDAYGQNAQTGSDSVDGLWIDIIARSLTLLWEGAGDAYNSGFFQTAEGQGLDLVLAILGLERLDAAESTLELALYGLDTTVITAGSLFQVEGILESQFQTDVSLTLGATDLVYVVRIVAVAVGETYTVTVDGTPNAYVALGGDTVEDIRDALIALIDPAPVVAANSGGTAPSGEAVLVLDLTAVVVVTSTATTPANIEQFDADRVATTATETGPTAAVAGTVDVTINPVAGLTGSTNTVDATVGRDRETDAEYRTRARDLLNSRGSASPDALVDRLLLLDGVTDARVIENLTDSVDAGGRPPHSFEAVVLGGVSSVIGQTLWDHKAAGIETFGNIGVSVTDTVGATHVVSFSRATVLFVHGDVTATAGEGFSSVGIPETDIAVALAAFGNALGLGRDVYNQQAEAACLGSIDGLASVVVDLGTTISPVLPTPPLSPADIIVDDESEITDWDTSRITVTIIVPP